MAQRGAVRPVRGVDARFVLKPGEGTDAIHDTEMYGYAAARLEADGVTGGATRIQTGTLIIRPVDSFR